VLVRGVVDDEVDDDPDAAVLITSTRSPGSPRRGSMPKKSETSYPSSRFGVG